ncbi:MAG: bifunctional (p)ppGpp synthetase/guanosine-3',5'-bis(diphosphate) 3'-pyrophosphohydrolase [Clostridia bacterium]|nr:bifunctional (p)ppGpp synthetase/guanosine-3',5'-bis(diphosphate) 3'-pyrophosphohydrolase [Clostridia bacterium]
MQDLLEKLYESYQGIDREMLVKAYRYSEKAHENQKRASGEPYFIHPCAVADILVDLGFDAQTIAAALLHDVIEDTPATEADIRREFGEEVLTLVLGVTKLEQIKFNSYEEEEAENFRKIFVAMAKDIRVIIIKLADRLHNMRSLNFLSAERQHRMAKETLEIYAPLAGRLGISQVKVELEDLCLKYLDPEMYAFLSENIHQKIAERHKFVESVVAEIYEMLKEADISGEVYGRPKHFYSIYKKMTKQNKTLDQIYDLTAVRVIVPTIERCYEVLGKIHNKWKPVPGRIKDYIATPKPNMYQSLHTTVVTPFGQPFEIQIRTEEMHKTAEYGIAAHWKYKENRTESTNLDNKLSWIREVMEWQGNVKDSKEFLESMKTELFSDELLVFTPHGKVISLPVEATPVDFAYAIHSEVGNKCVGAKVNSKIVPINSTLQTGDVVEIITSPNAKGPSWDWLKFVKSSGARGKIRQFFKKNLKEENIRTGKSILEQEAKRRGFSLSDLLTPESFAKLSERLSFASQEEMFASIGYGALSTNQVIFKLIDYYRVTVAKPVVHDISKGRSAGGVLVDGMDGLLVKFAGCCSPIPGDEIVGFVSRGRGVVVHRKDCPNLKNEDSNRIRRAWWVDVDKGAYNCNLRIVGEDQATILTIVSGVVGEMRLSIMAINGRIDRSKRAVVEVTVRLSDKRDIEDLIRKIRADRRIHDVSRMTGV